MAPFWGFGVKQDSGLIMNIIIVSVHVTVAVILVLTVLLQAGKGSGMGAAFGGSSGTVFGTRGPATLISKITCVAAVVFMCTSLNLALSQGGAGKKGSIMDQWPAAPAASAPAATSAAPSAAMATPAPAEETDASVTGSATTAETSRATENSESGADPEAVKGDLNSAD